MQPVGELYRKCGLVFLKFWLIRFLNGLLVGASQKKPIFGAWEKNLFLWRQ
jgi:hypothetical protein